MSKNENVSEMLVHVGGDLLKCATSLQEMQARLGIVKTAWNMSLISRADRKAELKSFIKKQKEFAPNKEALKGLEAEIKQVIKQKNRLYPDIDSEVVNAEAIEKGRGDYEIKAYFKSKDEAANA